MGRSGVSEAESLAPYAVCAAQSQGRQFIEAPTQGRSEFQRDRDRIVHSAAFRRLEYKTQVFINHEGDWFRTRLTHSLEVAQIARAVARRLQLNEDLTEAIALAHDLGHTPFGHAGQDALDASMQAQGHGRFEHNWQSLRVVDVLEERYADFDGLNLCFETREGILKHCAPAAAQALGAVGARFLRQERPSLEAQLANIADEIAYNQHDVDDGLRSGLITLTQLEALPAFGHPLAQVRARYPHLQGRRLIHETIRRMIHHLISDLVATSAENLAAAQPTSVAEVRTLPRLIGFSAPVLAQQRELKRFLRENLYQHYQVLRMMYKAEQVIHALYTTFTAKPTLLPTAQQVKLARDGVARVVADYIAGMTDRFAWREYQRVCVLDQQPLLAD